MQVWAPTQKLDGPVSTKNIEQTGPCTAGRNKRFAITIQMRKRYLEIVRAAGEKILRIFMSRMQFLLK